MTVPEPAGGTRNTRLAVLSAFALCLLVTGLCAVITHEGREMPQLPPVFSSLDAAQRPPRWTEGLTFLLTSNDPAAYSDRSEVIMLVRLSADRRAATVVSIPPDSWVAVPGHGVARMSSVSAFGGPALMVRTVETLTGVRVDHFAMTDLTGFRALAQVVGGVGPVDPSIADPCERQQEALRALISKVMASGVLNSPGRAHGFADAVWRHVQFDDILTTHALRSLAFELRELDPAAVTFVTAPISDGTRAGQLWEALRHNQIKHYLESTPR
ncbi:LCP family protein [Lentzea terrae]|uniref:LCP family protein n=1 Tax=Lentzea terrae TaxID=2200761 RepID=UPI000DD44F76|nr:LCP family protein [Lentzea terrae]